MTSTFHPSSFAPVASCHPLTACLKVDQTFEKVSTPFVTFFFMASILHPSSCHCCFMSLLECICLRASLTWSRLVPDLHLSAFCLMQSTSFHCSCCHRCSVLPIDRTLSSPAQDLYLSFLQGSTFDLSFFCLTMLLLLLLLLLPRPICQCCFLSSSFFTCIPTSFNYMPLLSQQHLASSPSEQLRQVYRHAVSLAAVLAIRCKGAPVLITSSVQQSVSQRCTHSVVLVAILVTTADSILLSKANLLYGHCQQHICMMQMLRPRTILESWHCRPA